MAIISDEPPDPDLAVRIIELYNRLLEMIWLRCQEFYEKLNSANLKIILSQVSLTTLIIVMTSIVAFISPLYIHPMWLGHELLVKLVLLNLVPVSFLLYFGGKLIHNLFSGIHESSRNIEENDVNVISFNLLGANKTIFEFKKTDTPLLWSFLGILLVAILEFLYVHHYVSYKLSTVGYTTMLVLFALSTALSGYINNNLYYLKQLRKYLNIIFNKVDKSVNSIVGELIEVSTAKDDATRKNSFSMLGIMYFLLYIVIYPVNLYVIANLSIGVSNAYSHLLTIGLAPTVILGKYVSSVYAYGFSVSLMVLFEVFVTFFFYQLFKRNEYEIIKKSGFTLENRKKGLGIFRLNNNSFKINISLGLSLLIGLAEIILFVRSSYEKTGSITPMTVFGSSLPIIIYIFFSLVVAFIDRKIELYSIYKKFPIFDELNNDKKITIQKRIGFFNNLKMEQMKYIVDQSIQGRLDLDKTDIEKILDEPRIDELDDIEDIEP